MTIEQTKRSAYPHLSAADRGELEELLEEFSNMFSERPERTGVCKDPIEIDNSAPVRMRPRRIPPHWEEEINTQLKEMPDQNICRPSTSPWASNVVLVTKKDSRQRFAVDYRRLNVTTKKDAYSIPTTQSILDRLHGSCCFSVIDISAAYWCVPVRECDVEKPHLIHQEDYTRY